MKSFDFYKISGFVLNSSKKMEFVRFFIVGVIATIIHYGVYYIFLGLIISPSISYSIGYAVSLFFNFYLTHIFTFRTEISFKRTFGFFFSHLVNYLLHILFLNVYLYIGFSKLLAPLPVYATVVPINFILLRTFFKNKE